MAVDVTVQVTVRTKPWWRRLVSFPFVARRLYKTMRCHGQSRLLSAYGAWLIAGLTIQVGPKR